ncbi:hypothetical protein [Pseudonocardia sp. ICBG601]|uniref:hypothetical protein n=1 Tax=Pseudonocardia sp. ICBG601 TaxID=2846759 RepID=UPI001CF62369|nr:hypothetical protein [Pseudonocardia sp. ICBG601]
MPFSARRRLALLALAALTAVAPALVGAGTAAAAPAAPNPTATTAAERYGWGRPTTGSDEFSYTGAPDRRAGRGPASAGPATPGTAVAAPRGPRWTGRTW